MILELFRYAVSSNRERIGRRLAQVESIVSDNSTQPERVINERVFAWLSGFRAQLDPVTLKRRRFVPLIEAEGRVSHSRICEARPEGRPSYRTELGDLIVVVDHLLIDEAGVKLVSGTASFLQMKKEAYATNRGIGLRQLYMMTYWPPFIYLGTDYKLDLTPDMSSFYAFFLDSASQRRWATSVASAPALTKALNLSEAEMINGADQGHAGPLLNNQFLDHERLDGSAKRIPFSLETFLRKALGSYVGSHSPLVRRFLRKHFFPDMPPGSDCLEDRYPLEGLLGPRAQALFRELHGDKPPTGEDSSGEEGPLYGVRINVVLKRIE